jgi:Ni,Fe-hydrogenase maturation factor
MSLRLFCEHIKQVTGAEVLLIGIQPQSVKLGEGLSNAVKQAADELIAVIGDKKYA